VTLPVERTDPAAAIRRAMRDRLDGLQADRLSELPLDELVRRIGRSREAKSRRTNLRRDERAWPAGDVEQGRASFRIEARAVLAELDAVLSPIEDAWLSRRIETRLVHAYLDFANELKRDPGSASLALLDGGLFGVAVLGAVAALAVPANSIRWFLERKAPPEPMLRGTQRERAALADLLARASAHSGFQEGWNLEAYVLRGMLQPLFEAAARENSSQWHVRDGVRRGLSQTLDLLDELDLDTIITNPTTALATARTTTEIVIWLVPVLRVIEKVPKIVVSCRGHEEDPRAQVSVITVGSVPRVSPRGSMKVL
jgi:hypothetical protein